MKSHRWARWMLGMATAGLVVAGCEVRSEALTCTRYGSALASCDDGTMVWDYSSRMRHVEGPGAETGLQGYPIPFGGRADGIESWGVTASQPTWAPSPAIPSAPPSWWQPGTFNRSRGGGCAQIDGRTRCW